MMKPELTRQRITKRLVDAVAIPQHGETRIWDQDIRGLCLRVYASGRRVYAVKCRVGPSQRWFTLGEHGSWTPEQARDRARQILHSARGGVDIRDADRQGRSDLTVAALIDVYLKDGPDTLPSKRVSAWSTDEANFRNHVSPLIGHLPLRDVSPDDVAKMLRGVRNGLTARDIKTGPRGRSIVKGGDGIAHRVKAATSAMFNWAKHRGLVEKNPVDTKLPRRPIQERFLSEAESVRLFATMTRMVAAAVVNPSHIDILRLLFLTGARKSEIAGLRWDEVDIHAGRLTLAPERTKSGGSSGERRIALSADTIEIISRQDRSGPLVFPAARGTGSITGLQKTWDKVRLEAELPGVRVHDLRHSFASFAIADGASLALIAKALGHSTTRVTERYAHLSDDPVVELASRNARRMLGG